MSDDPRATGPVTREKIIEAMGRAAWSESWAFIDRNIKMPDGDRRAAALNLKDSSDVAFNKALDALATLGLVVTTREVVEAARAAVERHHAFHGLEKVRDCEYCQLDKALRAAPTLTSEADDATK